MKTGHVVILGCLLMPCVFAGIQPFMGVSMGFSQRQDPPAFLLKDGAILSQSQNTLAYQITMGVKQLYCVKSFSLGVDAMFTNLASNRWGFIDNTYLNQYFNGVSLLGTASYHTRVVTGTLGLGAMLLHNRMASSGFFTNAASFNVTSMPNNWSVRPELVLGIEKNMSAHIAVTLKWQHVFGTRTASVMAVGTGSGPDNVDLSSWRVSPSFNSLFIGVTYTFL
jgi:hypothetical protein